MLTIKKLMMATTAIVIASGAVATADIAVKTETELGADAQVQGGDGASVEAEGGVSASGEASTEANGGAMKQESAAGADLDVAALDKETLIGSSVYDTQDVRVGEISEAITGNDGKVISVVIDVGGFLGIGEKPVELKLSDLTFEKQAEADAAADASGKAEGSAADAGGNTEGAADASGNAEGAAGIAGSIESTLGTEAAETMATLGYRVYVNMTKEQMEEMPAYEQ